MDLYRREKYIRTPNLPDALTDSCGVDINHHLVLKIESHLTKISDSTKKKNLDELPEDPYVFTMSY